jgi:hypothetical protein
MQWRKARAKTAAIKKTNANKAVMQKRRRGRLEHLKIQEIEFVSNFELQISDLIFRLLGVLAFNACYGCHAFAAPH